jgi:hypothetical protein
VWRGVLLIAALAIGITELLTSTPPDVRHLLYFAGGLCVVAWAVELVMGWKISRQAGSLKATERGCARWSPDLWSAAGPSARGPQHSGQFGPLLADVLAELRRDGITLLVQARDEGLAETYVRHGGVRPDPSRPRHIAWLAD